MISPFDGDVNFVKRLHVSVVIDQYNQKCDVDISEFFHNFEYLELYECKITGYKYWLPAEAAGNEQFYHLISKAWKNYYREERWEYQYASTYIKKDDAHLEIGCGKGFFLKQVEKKCKLAVGLEFNTQAITNKVCKAAIFNETIESHAKNGNKYDVVTSFQVLEHISKPKEFLISALRCVKPGGYLVLSTPNDDWGPHQRFEDAFNLPPHHVGCFNENIYRNIAKYLDCKVVDFKIQPCGYDIGLYSMQTEKRLDFRFFKKVTQKIGNLILRRANEPGHTILCIMQKLI